MNDQILILVSGGASNRQVANLSQILRRGGCIGKITPIKCEPKTLAAVQQLVEKENSDQIRSHGSWAGNKR